MAAIISSRTPEGEPNLCPVCDALICVEPSTPTCDGPCPACGVLLWFLRTSDGVRIYERNVIAPVRERVEAVLARLLRANPEELSQSTTFMGDIGADFLDIVVLVMELEEEFDFNIPDAEAERIRTIGDVIDWLVRHLR